MGPDRDRRPRPEPPISFDQPLEHWLQTGGDHRLTPLPATGLNKYRIATRPRTTVPLGSCTGSSPSKGAMEAAGEALATLQASSDPEAALADLIEEQRQRLAELFELPDGCTIAFTPSGTDAVYLVSALALGRQPTVQHVVVGAGELGGGTLKAARGEAISTITPHGDGPAPERIDGLHDRCGAIPVYLRDVDGHRLERDAIDALTADTVRAVAAEGAAVLHLVAHSKTGLQAPTLPLCEALVEELGDRLVVLVDAAQGRLAPRDVRTALDHGFAVLFTGSKFYSGPPFSCALLLPPSLAGDPGPLPAGTRDWFARADLPEHWTEARASLTVPHNLGLTLRWQAALQEMDAYHALAPRRRAGVFHTFAGAVYEVFGPCEVVELDVPRPPMHQLVTALGAYPTVFGFTVLGPEGPLPKEALDRLHRLLDSPLGPPGSPLGGEFHLGQPVELGPPGAEQPAQLRIALGARLATEHAEEPDAGAAWFRQTMGQLRTKLETLAAREGRVAARSPVADVPAVLAKARAAGLWTDESRAAVFHDLDRLRGRLAELHEAFPEGSLHAVAIKANPLVELLKVIVAAGAGLEAASWEEVQLAVAAGCPAHRIVFDSPAKSDAELTQALALGCWINADHEDELRRLAALGAPAGARIGLRVNPQVGEGAISFTSTVGKTSKFGVPLEQAPDLVARYPFVTGLHVHTGSQGCGLDLLSEAAAATAAVVEELGLTWLDVGGGVPVRYTATDPEPPSFGDWGEALSSIAGWGSSTVVTEVGRALHAGTGWALSRIEAVKEVDGRPSIVVHLGADFLLRRVYRPDDWNHEFVVLDPDGRPRRGASRDTDIAGPLCFSGDLIARRRPLPAARRGDLLLIRDVGAYTLAMWSRHCSRGLPPSWGYDGDGVRVLHRGEEPADVVDFWSLKD